MKKKLPIISEMPWYNVLRTVGSDYYENHYYDFPGTLVDFRFKKITQEIIYFIC